MADDLTGSIKVIAGIVLTAGLMLAVLSPFFGLIIDVGGGQASAFVEPQTGQNVSVDGLNNADELRVQATLGNALAFDGGDAVESYEPADLTNGSWTVCSVATLSDEADPDATYTVAAYEEESILVQYDAGSWVAYYETNNTSALARIDAPSPTQQTAVCGRYDEASGNLTVVRDGAVSGGETLDASTEARNLSLGWTGTLDEVRTFNGSLSQAQLNTFASDPIAPLPGADRSTRMMFDEGEGETTRVLFADSTATIVGATWTDGVVGPNVVEGTDYELRNNPLTFKALSGGYFDGAPAAYVVSPSGPFASLIDMAVNIGGSAFSLLIIGALVIAGMRVMEMFGGSSGF